MILDSFYNFYPSRVLLSIGNINIYWYGLFVFLGMLAGFCVYYALLKKQKTEKRFIFDSFFWCILMSLIFSRLFYVLYDLKYYISNPLKIFAIWDGGIAIFGGIIAGFVTLYLYCKKNNLKLAKFLNTASIALVVGQIIGRFGNYFNQELYGLPTNFFLKIPIAIENRIAGYTDYTFFMPLFFYEILANIIVLIILLRLYKKGANRDLNAGIMMKNITVKTFRSNMKKIIFVEKGGIFFVYINLYCAIRFILEFFRLGEPKFLNISINQYVIAVILIVVNIVWCLKNKKNSKKDDKK